MTPIRRLTACFALTTAAVAGGGTAVAKTGPWSGSETAKVRLISAATATGEADSLHFGLEFQLGPGWKIYWRSPGDAGLPPIPDWSSSDNVADVAMGWPVPSRFEVSDIGTLGYEKSVVFPLSVMPKTPAAPVMLRGSIDYLACSEICVPRHADVSLGLPSGPATPSDEAHAIDRYRAAVPATDPSRAGLSVEDAAVAAGPDGRIEVTLAVRAVRGDLDAPDAFLEGPGGAYFKKPVVTMTGDGGATLRFAAPARLDLAALTGEGLTVTLLDDGRALETRVVPHAGTLRAAAAMPIPTILGLALLGGLILNLMPCVLPVLSLKLMSVLRKSGTQKTHVRAGFLASAAGIMTSFALLAGAAIALKLTGVRVGWGIQFQQPVFLALMVALLTLFACNLAGLFEFQLPGAISDRAATAGGVRDGLFGDFLTGVFATLLATPCSAPFLGTAIGFALSAGPGEILAVFVTLGLGLALPYLAVAAFPGAVRLLPRPGRWIPWLKAVLALALIGAAIWLLTVLDTLAGAGTAVAVGALAAAAAAALMMGKIPGSRLGRLAWPVSAVLAAAAVLSPLGFPDAPKPARVAAAENIGWRPFDEAAIPALLAEGRTVLVDVTADWCLTCRWNEKTVLEEGAVADWLAGEDVVAMRADWTRSDPAIADYLARFGRYGIPFNVVYGPDAPAGIALPELLSAEAVLDAAARADATAVIAGGR